MEGFPQLIYDRTEEDLISGNEKGCYGVSDLNRVGQAVTCLANAWNNASYSVQVTTKTNWTVTDFPTASAMATYLQNIRNLIDAFYRPPDAPPLPGSLAKLTIEKVPASPATQDTARSAATTASHDFQGSESRPETASVGQSEISD